MCSIKEYTPTETELPENFGLRVVSTTKADVTVILGETYDIPGRQT